MFNSADMNGNGYLSLAEIDRLFKEMGEKASPIYLAKKVMLRAFFCAKDFYESKD